MLPTFQEINKEQKPFGTYDLYWSGDFRVGQKTVTVTVCRWEWKYNSNKETRIHRNAFESKIILSQAECAIAIPVLKQAIAHLNAVRYINSRKNIFEFIRKKQWSQLSKFTQFVNF